MGGATMTAMQAVYAVQVTEYTPEVLVTLPFIAGPLILGLFAIGAGMRLPGSDSRQKSGISMIIIGLLGLLLWAGLIIGPVLACISGVLVLIRRTKKPRKA
jgi:hypothetical protein